MPPMLIPALAFIVIVLLAVGLPSLAVVVIRYFKLKERELAMEVEYRQKSQQQGLAIEQRVQGVEQRVQRLEQVLTSLDHDVRERLGLESGSATSAVPLELLGGARASDADREESLDPAGTKAR